MRFDWLVSSCRPSDLPLPKMLSCVTAPESTTLSELEKPAPTIRLPVGFSLTVKLTSTWSVVPGTG